MANQGGGSSVWLWVGLGCGGLVLVLACVGGIGAFFYFSARDAQEQMSTAFEQAEAEQRRAQMEEEARRQAEFGTVPPVMPTTPGPMVPGVGPTDRTPRM